MTNKITAKELLDNYKKAIIIDMDRKQIMIIKKETITLYVKQKYQEVLDKFGITEFND